MPRMACLSRRALALVCAAGIVVGLGPSSDAQAARPKTREWRILVVPVTFDATTPDTSDLWPTTFGPTSTSVKSFFEHVSDGRRQISGEVAPLQRVSFKDPCKNISWMRNRPRGYDTYIFVSPHIGGRCNGNAGTWHPRVNAVWINGYEYYRYAIRHELGHSLDFQHTTNVDPYNAMDAGCDFQAVEKVRVGWLDNVTTAVGGAPGVYTLTATNEPGGRALRIRIPNTHSEVWAEVRDWNAEPWTWNGNTCTEPRGVVLRHASSRPRPTTLYMDGDLGYFTTGRAARLPNGLGYVCVRSLSAGQATVELMPTPC